jgi:hypothetical protein
MFLRAKKNMYTLQKRNKNTEAFLNKHTNIPDKGINLLKETSRAPATKQKPNKTRQNYSLISRSLSMPFKEHTILNAYAFTAIWLSNRDNVMLHFMSLPH